MCFQEEGGGKARVFNFAVGVRETGRKFNVREGVWGRRAKLRGYPPHSGFLCPKERIALGMGASLGLGIELANKGKELPRMRVCWGQSPRELAHVAHEPSRTLTSCLPPPSLYTTGLDSHPHLHTRINPSLPSFLFLLILMFQFSPCSPATGIWQLTIQSMYLVVLE